MHASSSDRLADAGHRHDRADRDDRVRRRDEHEIGADDGLDDAAVRARALDIPLTECDGGQRRAVPRPPLLEVQLALAVELVGVGDAHVRVDLGVGRGDESHAERPARLEAGRHLRRRGALAQPGGAREVGAEVEVAEREPRPPTPHSRSSAATRSVSPARPQPRSVSFTPASE